MNLSLKNQLNNSSVVIVIDSLDGGGAESQVLKLASGLSQENIDTTIFALRGKGLLTKKALNLKLKVIEGNFKSKRNIKSFICGFLLLCKIIRSKKPCIVHTFLPLSNFLGTIAATISGAHLIISSRRGLIKLNYLKKRWRFFDTVSNFLSNKITINSFAIRAEMEKIDSVNLDKVICIRNGIDLEKFNIPHYDRESVRSELGLSYSNFAWIKVANFSSIKGHEDLIKGFKQIDHRYNAKLFLVGKDNGVLNNLRGLVKELQLEKEVNFLGFIEDIPKILLAMDGYICASHTEGFSNAILEAMAAKLPVIATNVGGNPEIIKHGSCGILIDQKNKNDIRDNMIMLMENDNLRKKLSDECFKTVNEKYSSKKMIESYINLYKSG